MPVRTRKEALHLMENDDFVNIVNEQSKLYKHENEINEIYGAPLYSMSADSSNTPAFIHDPPTPKSASSHSNCNIPHEESSPESICESDESIHSSQTSETHESISESHQSSGSRQIYTIKQTMCDNVFYYYNYIANSKLTYIIMYPCKFLIFLLGLSLLHWILVSIYVKWCYEPSIRGIFANLFMVSSPLCGGINNIQQVISNHFITFWLNGVLLSTSFFKRLVVI
tara:strand:+ start:1098 stop:1775 length:678 start_codon:yes stop_codon:yes gene_type:complete